MKRIAAVFLLIVMFTPLAMRAQSNAPATQMSASAAGAASPQAPQGRKKRVAVFDFDYATVKTSTAALFGTDIDVGKGIADLLVKNLVTDGTYSVIERKQLDKILAEQNFSNSDRANPASAAKIGKILGLDAIIVGSITEFGNETKNRNIGGGGGGFGGFGIGGVGHKESKANVQIDARLVDIDTAEILGVAEGKGESKRSSNSLLGGGGNWHGFGGGAVDFGSSDFQQTIIGEATKSAVDQMTSGVIASAPKLQARIVKVEGLVAAVDGDQIVLNVGAKTGIKVGDHMSVERITSTIKDPATGAVLRKMTSRLGELVVTDVDDVSAVCKAVNGTGFKVGDMAKTEVQ
ncbi:MAG TPA: CsgG/HfaB family protein [Candidatus Saccharimonadales bacterium]|jgi:curli biogenesis system outer membrane secretion channel CsgG|nr:CsgG/HfaB family protein [Candidatus Saccharimonadales bacterium]